MFIGIVLHLKGLRHKRTYSFLYQTIFFRFRCVLTKARMQNEFPGIVFVHLNRLEIYRDVSSVQALGKST